MRYCHWNSSCVCKIVVIFFAFRYTLKCKNAADCLVTGEAAHHIAILAKQKGVGLVVAGHWGTEHPVVFALADALTERLPKEVTVAPSLADVDPYSYL